jgi:4-amino-4-deoxy-L-arabinose transferase-like glycosyltransferase
MAGDSWFGLDVRALGRNQSTQNTEWSDETRAIFGWLSPDAVVAILIAAQIIVWTLVPYIFHTSMPLDVTADGVSWGHEWQLGYYKHPPLPGWLVEVFFDTFADLGPFLLSQLAVGITYLLVYRLGRELMGSEQAVAGTILLAAVYYFSVPTPEWNHNIAQLPFWAAITLAYWRVCTRGTLRAWLWFGLCAGAGMLIKYSVGTLLAVLLLHFLWSGRVRRHLQSWGPYVALAAFMLVVAPHALWVAQHSFTTVQFFADRAGHAGGLFQRLFTPFRFLAAQLLALLPAILVAIVAGFLKRPDLRWSSLSDAHRLLFVAWAGPPLLAAFFSLISGLGLRDMWGLPMWNLTGLVFVATALPFWQSVSWKRLTLGVGCSFVIYTFGYVVTTTIAPQFLGVPSRTEWPQQAIAKAANTVWERDTRAPLHIVTGESWIAGLVAMSAPRPSVFIDAEYAKAPWVTPERLHKEGTLVVWQVQPAAPMPTAVRQLARSAKSHGTLQFSWPSDPNKAPLRVGWAVISPHVQAGEP